MEKALSIAIVTTEFVTEPSFDGGLANYTFRLCLSLIQLGHKPVVFVCSTKDELINYRQIPVHRVKIDTFDNRLYYSSSKISTIYKGLKKIALLNFPLAVTLNTRLNFKKQSKLINESILRTNQETKFDIIHYAHLGAVGFYRPSSIPCVSRLSSSTSEYEKFGGYGKNIHEVNEQERIELETLKKMDGIFGPSRTIAATISKQINKHIEIIESPYLKDNVSEDTSLFEEKLKGKKYVLFFGSIGQIKGAGTIARLIYSFLKENTSYHFVFIGKTLHSEVPGLSMIDLIKKNAAEFSDRVIHIGKIPHSQLYPILQNCSFCVLPSLIDNFPNTCIEAMNHKKIVIGTKQNGFEQLIDNNVSGFLINAGDEKELLAKINEVIGFSEERKRQIEAEAFKRMELLKPEKVVTQLTTFYNETIDNFHKN